MAGGSCGVEQPPSPHLIFLANRHSLSTAFSSHSLLINLMASISPQQRFACEVLKDQNVKHVALAEGWGSLARCEGERRGVACTPDLSSVRIVLYNFDKVADLQLLMRGLTSSLDGADKRSGGGKMFSVVKS